MYVFQRPLLFLAPDVFLALCDDSTPQFIASMHSNLHICTPVIVRAPDCAPPGLGMGLALTNGF